MLSSGAYALKSDRGVTDIAPMNVLKAVIRAALRDRLRTQS
jgi:hypothetical protein